MSGVDIRDDAVTPVCETCHNGCECEAGTPGCEHFCCWGIGVETTCPGAASERAALQIRRRTAWFWGGPAWFWGGAA